MNEPKIWSKVVNPDSKMITSRSRMVKPLEQSELITTDYPTLIAPPVFSVEAMEKQYEIARALHREYPSRKMAPREWILMKQNQKARLYYDPDSRQVYFTGQTVNPDNRTVQIVKFYSENLY